MVVKGRLLYKFSPQPRETNWFLGFQKFFEFLETFIYKPPFLRSKMLRKLLRYAALSTALFYNACQPPEKDLESQCEGEVLFEDEFDGSELDEEKWYLNGETDEVCGGRESGHSVLNNGILELNPKKGACFFNSRSGYALGNNTFCFEARWKLGERRGIDFSNGLSNGDGNHGSVDFVYWFGGEDGLVCNNYLGDGLENSIPCDVDVTSYHTTRLKVNNEKVEYFINNRQVAVSTENPVTDRNYFVETVCSSSDDLEKKCSLDYIKLLRE